MHIRFKAVLVACVSAMALAGAAQAYPITTVANPSFETLPASGLPNCNATGCWSTGSVPGWTWSGGGGQYMPDPSILSPPATDGSVIGWVSGGNLYQLVPGVTIQPGAVYTLTVDIGWRSDMGGPGGFAQLVIDKPGTPGGGANYPAYSGSWLTMPTPGGWGTYQVNYQALPGDIGDQLYIRLLETGGYQADFDNVRLDVPEPLTLTLLGAGLLGLGVVRRRRRKTA